MGIECKSCEKGVEMCYTRPCMGTPEEFDKLLDAGYTDLIQKDFWYRTLSGEIDISILTTAVYPEKYSGDSDLGDILSMLDFLTGASKPYTEKTYSDSHTGGLQALLNPTGKCVMLDEDNLCKLHSLDLKPEQGRQACCKKEQDAAQDNKYYADLWNTDYGRSIVDKWKKLITK